jgi:hypothetical protein
VCLLLYVIIYSVFNNKKNAAGGGGLIIADDRTYTLGTNYPPLFLNFLLLILGIYYVVIDYGVYEYSAEYKLQTQ